MRNAINYKKYLALFLFLLLLALLYSFVPQVVGLVVVVLIVFLLPMFAVAIWLALPFILIWQLLDLFYHHVPPVGQWKMPELTSRNIFQGLVAAIVLPLIMVGLAKLLLISIVMWRSIIDHFWPSLAERLVRKSRER